jgi:translation initiation factor 1
MSSMHKGAARGLVYSTGGGCMCPVCRQAVSSGTCCATAQVPAGDGVVRVSRETDGGGGKAVVLGMRLDAAMLAVMARGCAAPAARAVPSGTVMSRCRATMSSV